MTDWDAAAYARVSALQQAMAAEVLAGLDLAGTERVLDVGCGDGRVTAAIAARVPGGSVLGVDPSPAMIALATERFGPAEHPNLRFEAGDARTLPYRAAFDLVVSFNALHWVPEQDAVLGSIRAALKPDGRAVLRFVPAGERTSLEDVIEEIRAAPRWAAFFRDFRRPYVHPTPEEFAATARRAGLRVVRQVVRDEAWDFGSRAAFEAFARATFVEWTQHVPEPDRPAFVADVLDRYPKTAGSGPGEANTFKFYQMDTTLVPDGGVG